MLQALSDWEKYLNSSPKEPPLIQCALMHYQFEAIHPFINGNGRVGRLLITFLLCEKGLLSLPLLYLSAFFEKYREEYYQRLFAVSQQGDWKGWTKYFLRGAATQAKEAREHAKAILDLNQEIQERVRTEGNAPRHTLRIVDRLFLNPVVVVSNVARELELQYKSVKRCVDYLIRLGILVEVTSQRRNRIFVSSKIMDALIGLPFPVVNESYNKD